MIHPRDFVARRLPTCMKVAQRSAHQEQMTTVQATCSALATVIAKLKEWAWLQPR